MAKTENGKKEVATTSTAKTNAANSTVKTNVTTDTKERKPVVKRTTDELKATEVGKITLVITTAMKLANDKKYNREGIEGIDKEGDEGKAQLSGRMHAITRVDGKLANMDVNSDQYKKVKALAQKAIIELKAKNYGPSVKGLLNYCLKDIAVLTNRVFNPDILDGIEL